MKINNEQRFFGMLGFAMRAGRAAVGTDTVISLLKSGSVKLVIVSGDASDGARTRIFRKCEFYGVRAVSADAESSRLGEALGKTYAPVAIGIRDEDFAREILATLAEDTAETE